MKAYEIGPQTGIASLTATTRPDPQPGPGEAVLKVRLIGLNNRDIQLLDGSYGPCRPKERIPLSEGVGDVIAIGAGVTTVKVGDRAIFVSFCQLARRRFHAGGVQPGSRHHAGWLAG